MRDKVETILCESEAKHWNVFKSKCGHRKLLRKRFWSYFELKKECSEHLKRSFFSFFANFSVTKLKPFSGKVRQSVQTYLNQNLVIASFLENGSESTLSQKRMSWTIEKSIFQFFCKLLSDEVETVFWESEAMLQKLFR